MFIIELTYKKSLTAVNDFLEEHKQFLETYYAKGVFIASGAKVPRDGGMIIAEATEEAIKDIIKEDPFHIQSIADYKITQFMPSKYSDEFARVMQALP